ncbi:BON domain-containing protein [Edaphobacter albus]|uniref:BON domain-containing protein n=1 Tax=Edaphobacter sp. 4G125 TaxID=2763071 RepID=UPI001648D3ED|nr:BON domain-containing protein [Edaphobacter sp. 4G125]QNI35572.1 BON domain-containing protein [Edaphobacter sp. 4G125]
MNQRSIFWRWFGVAVVAVGLTATGYPQQKTVSDAQVEADVLKSLAGVPELADQAIGSSTVYGTVTLSGSVASEALRSKAEQAVANTPGVKKVVDELVIGTPAPTTGVSQPPEDTADDAMDQNQPMDGSMAQGAPEPQAPPQPQGAPIPPAPRGAPAPIEQSQGYPNYPYPTAQQPRQPYRVQQQAGQSVIVPAGSMIRIRINQAMDNRHTQPGTPFDGVVLNDVLANGMVAIPRGAMVQGRVSESQPSGDFRGRGIIALELNQVVLEGRPYPLATESWSHQGYDKTGNTVGATAGLGATGAAIGAVAGGGPGAALGAVIGAIVGLGASSASHQGDATVPAEAIVSFRLSQQAALQTVSQAELDRLGAGLPPAPGGPQGMRRRYAYPPPPPPPPYYYGPAYYPYPYPYYYPRYYR